MTVSGGFVSAGLRLHVVEEAVFGWRVVRVDGGVWDGVVELSDGFSLVADF